MKDLAAMERASQLAGDLYRDFVAEVVKNHLVNNKRPALADREKVQLGEATWKKVEGGKFVDPRALRLATISGKGGLAPDPKKQGTYDKFMNVSLLEHLLSVTRGATVLAAMSFLDRNPEMEEAELTRRLAVVASVGFLHDLDKDLRLSRNTELTVPHVEERMDRYGISAFLESREAALPPAQIRYLIEKVEATQSHRHPAESLPPRAFERLPEYVRWADRLDGAWLSVDPETGGLNGVQKCLSDYWPRFFESSWEDWRAIDLYDPLHPFLLDELQRFLSRACRKKTGVPPLIETHQDGRMFLLVPGERYEDIVKTGLDGFTRTLPFALELNVSNRGTPALYNARPDLDTLSQFVENLDARDRAALFRIKRDLGEAVSEPLDELLSPLGLAPRWPEKPAGQLLPIFADFGAIEESAKEWLNRATLAVLLLNLKVDAKPKDGAPDYPTREAELLKAADEAAPEWLTGIEDDASRRTLLVLWAAAAAYDDGDVEEAIWGETDGLLKRWLEGTDERPGLRAFISEEGAGILDGVRRRFQALLSGERVTVEDEKPPTRCLFTNEPVPFARTINQATGLYAVKVSAFSGRDGRPESVQVDRAHTNVGPSSIAEHRVRADAHALQGGRENGVPTLISTPATSGLFGGLALADDKSMPALSLFDLSRLEIKKGKVLSGHEMYRQRYRMARLERIPEKLEDQVNTLSMLMRACRRVGRPLHIFRGLPVSRREYFYFDAMPRPLAALLGGNGLFLEQLGPGVRQMELAAGLLEQNGLGPDTLKLYANPETRFGAACMAWCHLRDREKGGTNLSYRLRETINVTWEGRKPMTEQDGALVALGRAAAGIQKNPGGGASAGDELLVFKLCLDTVNTARKEGQDDDQSLIYAVAGELETNLARRQKAAARDNRGGKSLMEGCMETAELFVKKVWHGPLQNRFPSQKSRRVLSSIYRVAFLATHKERAEAKKKEKEKSKDK